MERQPNTDTFNIMARIDNNPMELKARLAAAGITLYIRNGRTILRPSRSDQPRRMTRKQFALRQRMIHNNALWRELKQAAAPCFEGGSSPCHRFRSLNTASPALYLTRDLHETGAALLLPSMVVSDGPLEPVGYHFGEAGGRAALLTDLRPKAPRGERYRLYLLRQEEWQGVPRLRVAACDFCPPQLPTVDGMPALEFLTVDGRLALAGDAVADPMCGFALVRLGGGQASPQRVETRCTYYRRFTSEEALVAAAESYGGLTR